MQLARILTALNEGYSILMEGLGGSGKSFTIIKLVEELQKQGKNVYCTATTGVAALNLSTPTVKASTLHRWAGIGLGDKSVAALVTKIRYDKMAKERWTTTDILIIDEVSMLGGSLFEKLDYIGRNIRNNASVPFGGLLLVLCADFLQLPPVNDTWVFLSPTWESLTAQIKPIVPVIFKEPKRYPDLNWFEMLSRIRKGEHTQEDVEFLYSRQEAYNKWITTKSTDLLAVKPTILHSKRADVESENTNELEKLPGQPAFFKATDTFVPFNSKAKIEYYEKSLDDAIPKAIYLKIGAQVMLKANLDIDAGLANGSRGVIVSLAFDSANVKWRNGTVTTVGVYAWSKEDKDGKMVRSQIPLILAWSATIHKCISGDTLVSTKNGLFYMKELVNKEGWHPLKLTISTRKGWETTSKIYSGEEEESVIIQTRMGYFLEGSTRHPVLVRDSDGVEKWKKLPEIEIGDALVMKYNFIYQDIPYLETKTYWESAPCQYICEEFGYMLGLVIGDGSYVDQRDGLVDFCNTDVELLNTYSRIAEKLLGVRVCSYKMRRYFCRKQVREFLLASGLKYSKGPTKTIPWIILRSSASVQKCFIRGLFDTDGGINKTCIHFTTSSPIMAKEVQVLLLSFGIISRRYEMPNDKSGAWRIEITGHDQRLWLTDIGFGMKKKQIESEKFSHKGTPVPKSNIGALPDSKLIATKLRDEYHLSKKNGTSQLIGRCINGRGRLHFRHLPFLRENIMLEETQIGKSLCNIIDDHFFYDQVVSISHGKCLMYDFEVPGSNSFVTNGIVSHNCQGITLDYAVCNLGPSVFCPGQAYVSLSRVRESDGLYLSDFYPGSLMADKDALRFVEKIEADEDGDPARFIIVFHCEEDREVKAPIIEPPQIQGYRTVNADIITAAEEYIIQQCNCLTVKAHGLSETLEARFPHSKIYSRRRSIGSKNLAIPEDRAVPGTFTICAGKPKIVCLFGQWRPGSINTPYFLSYPESNPPETKNQRLLWFKTSLESFAKTLSPSRIHTLAIPYHIGCGLAGGEWDRYEQVIKEFYERYIDLVRITIYRLNE